MEIGQLKARQFFRHNSQTILVLQQPVQLARDSLREPPEPKVAGSNPAGDTLTRKDLRQFGIFEIGSVREVVRKVGL